MDTERDTKTLSAAGKSSPTACQNVQFDVVFVNPYPVLTEDLSPDSSGDYWLSTLKVCAGRYPARPGPAAAWPSVVAARSYLPEMFLKDAMECRVWDAMECGLHAIDGQVCAASEYSNERTGASGMGAMPQAHCTYSRRFAVARSIAGYRRTLVLDNRA